jgi:Fe-S cluster biogenesis protein NfuA/nitrite reductase/ring-hydroxylating ferredoxin subunit
LDTRNGTLERRLQQLESLIGQVESLPDESSRRSAVDAIQALLQLHGDGLERILTLVREAGEPGEAIVGTIAGDEFVSGLLVLHGLHPLPQDPRVRQALDKVRPYLGSHGGDVELLSVEDGVVSLRLRGTCDGCPSSAMTLKYAIEQAIYEGAPDVTAIEVDGVTPPPAPAGFIPLTQIKPATPQRWRPVPELVSHEPGTVQTVEVGGSPVLFLHIDSGWYAYFDGCPACGRSLAQASLESAVLACPGCGHRYDVRLAGRCQDAADLNLRPLPLLVESGQVRVAAG